MSVRWIVLPLILVTSAGCGEHKGAETRPLTVEASDGVRLAGTLYLPVRESPPGLILVHRLGSSNDGWAVFARRAQQAGYMVIALDLRGHGDSTGSPSAPLNYRSFSDSDWQKTLRDIDAARKSLLEAGADPDNLFIAGEALGASLSLEYAVSQADIQGVIMVSPGLDYKGIDTAALMKAFTHRPALLIWGEGDALAASSASTLSRVAEGHLEVHSYAGAAHGTDLFTLSPHAIGQAMIWLEQMLTVPANGR